MKKDIDFEFTSLKSTSFKLIFLKNALGVNFAVCAGFSVRSGNITNGIWFDHNYAIGLLTGNYGK